MQFKILMNDGKTKDILVNDQVFINKLIDGRKRGRQSQACNVRLRLLIGTEKNSW